MGFIDAPVRFIANRRNITVCDVIAAPPRADSGGCLSARE